MEKYHRHESFTFIGTRKYMNMFTSRACPYGCIYCHNMFGKGFRAQSPENIVNEMQALVERYGLREFEIVDDVFNLDRGRVRRLCELILDKNLDVRFTLPNGIRADIMDRDLVVLMKRAGVSHMTIAVETASPRLMKLFGKNLNLARVREIINECDRQRIHARGYFMLGFPTETREEMLGTIRFAASSRLHTALFFIVVPFKGTPLYELYKDRVPRKSLRPEDYAYYTSTFNLSEVPDEELYSLQQYAYRKFYFNPLRKVRHFLCHPHRGALFEWKRGWGLMEMLFSRRFLGRDVSTAGS